MKTNITNFILFLLLGVVSPLLQKIELLIDFHCIVLTVVIGVLIFSQPPFTLKESRENNVTDQGSLKTLVACSILVIICAIVDWAYGLKCASNLYAEVLGVLIISSGFCLRIWAIKTLGRHFTTSVVTLHNHVLIQSGPYKLLRHPSYAGAMLIFSGSSVFLGSLIGLAISILLMGFAYKRRIDVEEKALSEIFGSSFHEYRKSTNRMIPFIW